MSILFAIPLHDDKDQGDARKRREILIRPENPPQRMVELNGIEPMTSCLQSRRSPN
jgi:hypothetical protein